MNAATADSKIAIVGKAWPDLLLGLALAIATAIGTSILTAKIPPVIMGSSYPDIYFSSDISRVLGNMSERDSDHNRTKVHPLSSLILYSLYTPIASVTGMDRIAVSRILSSFAAFVAMGAFYGMLRAAKVRRIDATIFCLLVAVSGFSIFWFAVPETYPWGCASILIALFVIAIGCRIVIPGFWYAIGSAASLSITTTNWMVGILGAWASLRRREAARWTGVAFAIIMFLALIQKAVFPTSGFFLRRLGGETSYVASWDCGGPAATWISFFAHTIVVPNVVPIPDAKIAGKVRLRTQASAPGSGSKWGVPALCCWAFLLAAGIWSLFTVSDLRPLRLTLGLALFGQLLLHTIYGSETFLYAAHYGPLLLATAALATRTKLRPLVLCAAVLLAAFLVLNNSIQFNHAMELIGKLTTVAPTAVVRQ